jgi:hypothetical protein
MPVSIGSIILYVMIQQLAKLWKEADTAVDYIVVLWIYLLLALVVSTWIPLVIELFMNPERFSNITFGLIDYI